MDLILKNKLKDFNKSLSKLEIVVEREDDEYHFIRDSRVQRFEFTFELYWKTLKTYIYVEKNINHSYARDVFRECRSIGILTEQEVETSLEMLKDRNFCAHAYAEKIVAKIALKIPKYSKLFRDIFNRLKE